MTHFRKFYFSAVLLGAVGAVACSTAVDEPATSSVSAPSRVETAAMFYTTPDDAVAVRSEVAHPAAALSFPRDGQCVEGEDATGICSLASGRTHFYSCAAGGAPPKPLPECKGMGGSTHWCCF